ncbi:MAG: hypothetical protein ACFFD2_16120 [Promethearchaeota archaeon]
MKATNNKYGILLTGLIIILIAVSPISNINNVVVPRNDPCNQNNDLNSSVTIMTLYEATTIYSSLVDVTIRGTLTGFYGECIEITLVQQTIEDVTIIITFGVIIIPDDPSIQTMVIAKAYTIELTFQWESITIFVFSFCIEATDYAPDDTINFTVSSTPYGNTSCVGKILTYFETVNNTYLGTIEGQLAIWACTDGVEYVEETAEIMGVTDAVNEILAESGTGLSLGDGNGNGGGIPGFQILPALIVISLLFSISIIKQKRNKNNYYKFI